MDDFEEDLKVMAQEAKEVRDRLKADLARAEAHATALTNGTGGEDAEAGAAGGGGGGSVSGGGGDAERRALLEVDRVTGQLGRASTAVDLACFLRDAALSFLQE